MKSLPVVIRICLILTCCVTLFSRIAIAQVPCIAPSLTGKLTYDNSQNIALGTSIIFLKTLSGNIVDSTITDYYGNFRFCDVVAGSYKLSARTNIAFGGVNATDALTELKQFIELITLSDLQLKAADVNGNSYVNSTDALLIAKRFVNFIDSFSVGDWVFEEPLVTISGTSTIHIDMRGLCTGDLDGSYVPPVSFHCGDTLIDLRDSQKYPTRKIGQQCWMGKNLNAGIMASPHNNSIVEKYCYSNNVANCGIYGGLYTWYEMMTYSDAGRLQGICPAGWRIPTVPDWDSLVSFLGGSACAGGKLKETGLQHWLTPNTGADNSSGFAALGAGYGTGGFAQLKNSAYFWSSFSETIPCMGPGADATIISYNTASTATESFNPGCAFSVRCIRDTCIDVRTAQAGPDQLNLTGTLTYLSANPAGATEAVSWSILGGEGGSFENMTKATSAFYGDFGETYTLRWTIYNVCDTSYDDVIVSFQPLQHCPGLPSFDYAGQTYNTVQIGSQCWMKENLNIGDMVASVNTGSTHTESSNNNIIEKYCINNNPEMCHVYGGLYDWNEMMQYTTTPGIQGICPSGWHIPTFDEWCTLSGFLDSTYYCEDNSVWSGESLGDQLKESGNVHWAPNNNTNISGFSALGASYRAPDGGFGNLTIYTGFWTSSDASAINAKGFGLEYWFPGGVGGQQNKSYGQSIRCLKN